MADAAVATDAWCKCTLVQNIIFETNVDYLYFIGDSKSYLSGFSEDLTHEILSLFWDIFFVTFLKCIKVTHKCFRRGLKRGRLNRTSETLKKIFFQFCWRGYFAHVSITYAIVSHLGCQPLLKITKMAAISLNLMIGTCNKNWTPTKFGLIDNFDMLSAILDVSHYLKSQNWLPFL